MLTLLLLERVSEKPPPPLLVFSLLVPELNDGERLMED